MAKEDTIRKHAIEELTSENYVVYVPSRTRFGSGTTYAKNKDSKQGNDMFTVFDLAAWKAAEFFLLQYTVAEAITTRRNKIQSFMKEHDLEIPCRAAVWGYEDRKGFTRKIELNSG